jgi:hypothetical protein
MSCERARELIIDALVEPLDAEQAAELNEHLVACEACAAEAAGYGDLWQQLGAAVIPEPATDGLERLQARVDAEFGDKPQGANRGWAASLRKAAAVVLLVGLGAALAVGFDALRQPAGPEPAPGDRYLLILTATNEPPEQTAQFGREMSTWVGSLLQQGIAESFQGVSASTPDATPPGGPLMTDDILALMIIRASSPAEARRIALQAPSLQYGGLVEIRAIN